MLHKGYYPRYPRPTEIASGAKFFEFRGSSDANDP